MGALCHFRKAWVFTVPAVSRTVLLMSHSLSEALQPILAALQSPAARELRQLNLPDPAGLRFDHLESAAELLAHALAASTKLSIVSPGTPFQQRVWSALLEVPMGSVVSYSSLAESIGSPRSARAVARACATNPLALITPCHRVVASDGSLGGYRWGVRWKAALLKAESRIAALSDPP